MSKLTEAYEYTEIAKYNNGKADEIGTILNMFEKELSEKVKEWLHNERSDKRKNAIKAYEESLNILGTK